MGIGSGAIGRRAQASHDALRRRQKAKAAAKVKKHRRFKNKAKLFAQLESTRTLETTPIVAAEYDDSLAEDERVSTEKARNGFEVEKEACSQKRKHLSGQPKSKEGCVHGNSPGSSSVAFLAPSADSGDMQSAQDSDPRRQVIDSVVAVARNRQQRDLASQDSVELFLKNSEGNDQNMLAAENQLRGSTLSPKGSRYQPFKKELAIAAARRLEIQEREANFQQEKEARETRNKEASDMRREKTKLLRKRTRRGQPVMKHRIDALLDRIERSVSKGTPNTAE